MSEVIKKQIAEIVRKRVEHQCEGTAVSRGKRCLHTASVGSILCSQHGAPKDVPKRYIAPKDFPAVIDELYEAIRSVGTK